MIEKILAQLSCSDLAASTAWFEILFGRAPDDRPMDGLVEWHHDTNAGLQLFVNPANAGKGSVTLIVSDLEGEHRRLTTDGLEPSEIQAADAARLVELRDPDKNLVVLAQPTQQ